jgi:hypothetical protein
LNATAYCRVVLDKLAVTQPIKKDPAFDKTTRFITVLTTARHFFLS